METTTTTTVTTTNTFAWCATESGNASVFNFADLYAAYLQCRRRKRGTSDCQHYEQRWLDNLFDTLFRLQQQSYQPTTTHCFVAVKPKAREIHAANFADRVVHHWLVPRLAALYEPIFIHDLYSNREGKGTHAAVKQLQHFMRSKNLSGLNRPYFLQLDIHNFFNSIDRPILFKQLQKRLGKAIKQGKTGQQEAQALRWLCHVLLKHDLSADVQYIGKAKSFSQVPPHKRFGALGADKGLPIGNLTSQFFANVYLNELDQFIKHQLKCRHYLRYVDDFILLHQEPAQLRRWQQQISVFLQQNLLLQLKPGTRLAPVADGADFLGYIVRPHYRLVRRRVVGNLYEKLHTWQKHFISGSLVTGWRIKLYQQAREQLRTTLSSYLGHFQHAHHYRLVQRIFTRFAWLSLLFQAPELPLHPLWQPQTVSSYRSQIAYFRRLFPKACLHTQRGRECDFVLPGISLPISHTAFNLLKTLDCLPKQAANPQNLSRLAVSKLVIREAGFLKGGLKRRLITQIHTFPGVPLCYHV
ncbi:reverse transcriptase domain-containing protein [Candidatus Venteria ishoeyi]|uniref:reverse transcriptase domain-containing protein n=1 Tax=Candidatus Venteria ishoeyi TaxID=1899563 RepID=UPI0025A52F25|nr:reverse transcriptase domain-containing protein [Candidatus Venteria ishoeyi]MDM8544944.1 reverse transcriptase domain-containing protein [Candidatus Venteria ishoeyi]